MYKKNNLGKVLEQEFNFACSKEKVDEIRKHLRIKSRPPVDLVHIEHKDKRKCIKSDLCEFM